MSQLTTAASRQLIPNVPNPEPTGFNNMRAAMMQRYFQQMANPYGLSGNGPPPQQGKMQAYNPYSGSGGGGMGGPQGGGQNAMLTQLMKMLQQQGGQGQPGGGGSTGTGVGVPSNGQQPMSGPRPVPFRQGGGGAPAPTPPQRSPGGPVDMRPPIPSPGGETPSPADQFAQSWEPCSCDVLPYPISKEQTVPM
jgi:hypothetical protein